MADVGAADIEELRAVNAELRRERERAEAREAAVRDVAQAIARTTFDLDAVLQTVIDQAVELSRADLGNLLRRDGDVFRVVAFRRFSSEYERLVRERVYAPERDSVMGRALLERRVVQILDVLEDPEYTLADIQRAGEYRTIVGVPMLREGEPIGVMAVGRVEVRPFDDAEIRLLDPAQPEDARCDRRSARRRSGSRAAAEGLQQARRRDAPEGPQGLAGRVSA
jgi:two-component system, NtrC family, sensor kinase